MEITNKGYDFNVLMKTLNIILCISCFVIHIFTVSGIYINPIALFILFFIAVENHLFLNYEKIRRNPFIIILVANSILFYFSRIFTLQISGYSNTLKIDSINFDDFNKTLFFILLANASMFLGLIVPSKSSKSNLPASDYQHKTPLFIIPVLLFFIFINHYILYLPSFIGIKGYIGFYFANMEYIFLIVSTYLVLFNKNLNIYSKIILFFIILSYGFFLALFGSRSGLLMIFSIIMCTVLAVMERIVIRRSIIIALAILAVMSLYLYTFATALREMPKPPGYYLFGTFSLDRVLYILHYTPSVAKTYQNIFSRVGFLDSSVDLIKNDILYSKIINLKYYAKSIIDNGLTPGFNIFDAPKAANALRHIYTKTSGFPTHVDIANAYHADMFTIYGEFYILFGKYLSLLFLFIFTFATKTIYQLKNFDDPFLFCVYKASILLLFYHQLNSFGLDWLVFDLVGVTMAFLIFGPLFKGKKIKGLKDSLSHVNA